MSQELHYNNPIVLQRADPYVYRHTDGYYYFTASVPAYDCIELRKAKTIAELAEAVNISVKGVEWQIRQLKKKNIIRRVGADKGGYWQIIAESED